MTSTLTERVPQALTERVRAAIAAIERRDPDLANEMESKRGDAKIVAEARSLEARLPELESRGVEAMPLHLARETIVLRMGRPVLTIARDTAVLQFADAESEVWRQRLGGARDLLARATRAVGRIEVENHHKFDWVGTGWLVADDVVVTNRHVAQEFAGRGASGFVFRQGRGGRRMTASIDFLEEVDRAESMSFAVRGVVHIEDEGGPDVALLKLEAGERGLARPIQLARRPARVDQLVAVIGYPARDSRIPDQQLMEDLFGSVYDKKRLAPGQITAAQRNMIHHDCTTLGGNSGSVVLDLESGEALGLHFAGRYLEANFAVPAELVRERLTSEGRTRASIRAARVDGDVGRPTNAGQPATASTSANVSIASGALT